MNIQELIDTIRKDAKNGTEMNALNCLIALEIIDGILCVDGESKDDSEAWLAAENSIDEIKLKLFGKQR